MAFTLLRLKDPLTWLSFEMKSVRIPHLWDSGAFRIFTGLCSFRQPSIWMDAALVGRMQLRKPGRSRRRTDVILRIQGPGILQVWDPKAC